MTFYEIPKSASHPLDKYRDATVENFNCTNLTGSTISGSTVRGTRAVIPNISTVNITGSGNVSGSAVICNSSLTLSSGASVNFKACAVTSGASINSFGLTVNVTGSTYFIPLCEAA